MTHTINEICSSAIRGLIIAPPGRKLCIADLSNIEGRGLAYLAGEKWKLQAFRDFDAGNGADIYKLAYARAFNVDAGTVDKAQRQIGKVMELGLGYGGGVAAFLTFAAVYQMDLAELADAVHSTAPKEAIAAAYGMWDWTVKQRRSTFGLEKNVYVACEVLKAAWRAAHPATVALWNAIDTAMRGAIAAPGVTFDAGPKLKVRRDGNWLRVRLPSGRYLCYVQPRIESDNSVSYMGISQYTKQWTRIRTYGGKGAEQSTQGFARDVFACAGPRIEAARYELLLGVHDEWVTETPDTDDFSGDALADLLAQPTSFAPDLPLAAAGFSTYRYRK